jgi:hypothetical protein
VLLAAFLLAVSPAVAGPAVRAGHPAPRPRPAPAVRTVAVAPAATLSVLVTVPAQPATEPFSVGLRGPDGQVQSFLVEGDGQAIPYRQTALRAGASVTIRLAAR